MSPARAKAKRAARPKKAPVFPSGPALELRLEGPAVAAAALVVVDGHPLPATILDEARRQWAKGPVAVIPTLGRMAESLLVALERPKDTGPLPVMRRFGAAVRALLRERVRTARVVVPAELADGLAEAVVLGLSRGLYRFDRYKSKRPPELPSLVVIAPRASWLAAAERALPVAEGLWLVRDLVNTPAQDMGPDEVEAVARRVARETGLRCRVLDADACARLGMGALTTVGRASTRPPRLVVLEHRGAPRSKDVLAIAGKGICFDSGGLNLKHAAGMELMKKDMAGAATVLGVAWAVVRRAPKTNVRFYLAIAENAVAGDAMRPGDVVTALDGTTIEIVNTDAEGRLVLADAVAFAVQEGATRVIDIATLTGAAMVAVGRVRVPLVGSDEELLGTIERAADVAGERVWRFPTDPEYRDAIKSKVADLRNTGKSGEAGLIAGGLFIGHFAGRLPWAHLDISPGSWADAAHDLGPEGATGVMVATLAHVAMDGPGLRA